MPAGTLVPSGSLVAPGGAQGPSGSTLPVGAVISYCAGGTPPASFMVADGSALSRTLYPDLFTAIGTQFGAGDGSTTFNLPDLRGRIPLGAGLGGGLTNRVLAAIGGEENHILSIAELAAHNHAASDSGHNHVWTDSGHTHNYVYKNLETAGQGGATGSGFVNLQQTLATGNNNQTCGYNQVGNANIAVANNGGGGGHNNMQPYLVLEWIIKVSVTGGPTAQAPVADQTQNGLLRQLSGKGTDYVGGDNACHPLPSAFIIGGRLATVSVTSLSYLPFKGAQIRIYGNFYTIPSGGVTGLANTGVFVNGVASQNLAASTLYYVYCFNNGGVLTADFSTTTHATSATAGNEGTEIKSGDDTRTLLGMILTDASGLFADTGTSRWVRSWLNRKRCTITTQATSNLSSTSVVALIGAQALCWGDESAQFSVSGNYSNNYPGPNGNNIYLYLDGAQIGYVQSGTLTAANYQMPVGLNWAQQMTEGNHIFQGAGNVAAGVMNFLLNLTGTIE